jgi:hypothetical protein
LQVNIQFLEDAENKQLCLFESPRLFAVGRLFTLCKDKKFIFFVITFYDTGQKFATRVVPVQISHLETKYLNPLIQHTYVALAKYEVHLCTKGHRPQTIYFVKRKKCWRAAFGRQIVLSTHRMNILRPVTYLKHLDICYNNGRDKMKRLTNEFMNSIIL